MQRSVLLSVALFAAACRGEADSLVPLEALACEDAARAGSVVELVSTLGYVSSVRMGPCGEVTYADPAGAVFRAGPELVDAEPLLPAGGFPQISRRGEQLLVAEPTGETTWRHLEDGVSVTLEADASGFVRWGDGEVAWACVEGALGTIGPEGFTARVEEGTARCDRIWPAAEAPVLAFVGEEALRVLDLEGGELSLLEEVPFIAASSDQVKLSRDGRVLFHQPASSPVTRIGIFDLSRREGDRFVDAPEVRTNLWGMVEARRAGHTAAMLSPTGVLVLTPDGFLNHYEGASLLALSPDGGRVLLAFPPTGTDARYELVVSDLDALILRPVGTVAALPTQILASAGGESVAAWGRLDVGGALTATLVFRWDTETATESLSPISWRQPMWVGEGGAALFSDGDGQTVLHGEDGRELRRWAGAWGASAWEVRGGEAVLVRVSDEGGVERLVVVSATTGASQELYAGQGINAVMVDAAGERLAYLLVAQDEEDPTQVRSRLFAGAIP